MAHIVLQALEAVDAVVEYFNRGTKRQGRPGSMLTNDAGANDDDLGRGDTRYTTQQHTLAVVGGAKVLSGDKHRSAACYFTHAAYDGIGTAVVFKVLERNGCNPLLHHLLQQVSLQHRQVNGRNDHLAMLQQGQVFI